MRTFMRRRSLAVSILVAVALWSVSCLPAGAKDIESKTTGQTVAKQSKKLRASKGRLPAYYRTVVTEEQRHKIYDIQKKYMPEIKKLRAQLDELKQQCEKEMDAVLTPEQREKVEQLKTDAKEKRKNARASKAKEKADQPDPITE